MPRPTNRDDLRAEIDKDWNALHKYLESLEPAQLLEPDIVGHWSVKDVLAHIHEWAVMCHRWYTIGETGETPNLPAEGYTWRQTPELNEAIYQKHKERELDEIKHDLNASRDSLLGLIDKLDDTQLFERAHFPWASNNAMSAYINSATSAHYRWAKKEIRKGFREKAKQGE